MGMTSEKSLLEIQKLYDMCFQINSRLDRMVYLLDIEFNLPKFQDYFHHKISHLFPLLADKIQDFGSKLRDLFYRGSLEKSNSTYETVSSMMADFVALISNLQLQCVNAIKVCIENDDIMYEDFLRDFQKNEIVPLLKQSTIFHNATRDYEENNNIYKWNSDFTTYVIESGDDNG